MDDILLTTNDKGMPHGVKQFLSKNIDIKIWVRHLMSLALRSIKIDLTVFYVSFAASLDIF